MHLCNQYIEIDKIKYDSYLQYIEVIDNEHPGEGIDTMYDPMGWNHFVELLDLYMQACRFGEFDEDLAYKIDDIFWRLCESKNVDI